MSLAFSPCKREQSELDAQLPTGKWDAPSGPTELPIREKNVGNGATAERRGIGGYGVVVLPARGGNPKEKAPAVKTAKGLLPWCPGSGRSSWASSLLLEPRESRVAKVRGVPLPLGPGADGSCPSCIRGEFRGQ